MIDWNIWTVLTMALLIGVFVLAFVIIEVRGRLAEAKSSGKFLLGLHTIRSMKGKGDELRLYKERAGLISENEVWCCAHEGYLYTADTLKELIKVLNDEWEDDRHLA